MTPDELARLSPGELAAYRQAWEERQVREDLRAGYIATILANANRDTKKRPRPYQPWDFFPSLQRFRPAPPTPEELYAMLKAGLT